MTPTALIACELAALGEELNLALTGLDCEGVERTGTAAAVLRRLADPAPPGLVVLDPSIPGGDHPDLARRIRTAAPEAVVLVVVDPDATPEAGSVPRSGQTFRYLLRPWTPEELRTVLRSALSRASLLAENRRLAELEEAQRSALWEERERLARAAEEATERVAQAEQDRADALPAAVELCFAVQEAYDPGLALHARAVASGARDLARDMALPDATIQRIETAGLVHDIGYVGLPRFLTLRSRENLTEREEAEFRRHAEIGEGIVAANPALLAIAPLVRHHHESFDGQGFPDGLRGEGIPLGARILRLVDVYDRAFRSGVSLGTPTARNRGRKALLTARGRDLDPELVNAFLQGAVHRADTREVQVGVEDLSVGMVLSRDLRATNGLFLAAGGTRLEQDQIERIQAFHRRNPLLAELFVRPA